MVFSIEDAYVRTAKTPVKTMYTRYNRNIERKTSEHHGKGVNYEARPPFIPLVSRLFLSVVEILKASLLVP